MHQALQRHPQETPEALASALSDCKSAFNVAFVFSLVINLLLLSAPVYMLQVYDRVLSTGSLETLVLLTLIVGLALLLMCALDTIRSTLMVRAGCWLSERLGPVYMACGIRARLNGDCSGAQPLRDVGQIQNFVGSQALVAFFDAPWVPIFIAFIWVLHPLLGLVALISALVLLLLGFINETATRNPAEIANKAQIQSFQQAESSIRNAEVITAMGMTPAILDRWRQSNAPVNAAMRSIGERGGFLIALSKFIRHFVQLAILGFGAWLVVRGEITAGAMIAASILLGRALAPVEMAIGAWKSFVMTRQAYKRLALHLNTYPPRPERTRLPSPQGLLEVEDLSSIHPHNGEPILRRVTFRAEPGEAIAVIGPSGAGKSTLCRSLAGLVTPSGGAVRLDGSDLRHWDTEQLGRHIGFLPQDVELFSGTVRENIARMARDISDDAVMDAACLSHAHSMIQRLPQGYDTRIGEGGVLLSGGQRQRIGLARAVYGNPCFIVLDEPNANLDQAGEAALAAALRALKEWGAALIIVGHRPSTLAEAGKVLFLQQGMVMLFGPRDEVLQQLTEATAAAGDREAVPMKRQARTALTAALAKTGQGEEAIT